MRKFSSRTNLYRTASAIVILAAFSFGSWHAVLGQVSKSRVSKGPRAVGLIELLPKSKARLIPIVILVDGQYYDADAYKASPVPMALWAETEYEAFRTGVSQGVFIVTEALQNQKTNEWIGEGSWQTSEELAAKSNKKARPSVPRGLEDDSGPPVLRHSGAAKPKPPEAAAASQSTQSTAQKQPESNASGAASSSSGEKQTAAGQGSSSAASAPSQTPSTSKPSSSAENPEQADEQDPNRPVLKRGKSVPAPIEENIPGATAAAHTPGAAPKSPAHGAAASVSGKAQPRVIPAISDADGPEPHTYQYDIKAADETGLRNKMLGLAGDEVRARAKQLSSELIAPARPARTGRAGARERPVQPNFEDVQFRIFDLSSSNEPTMVLTASARMPDRATESALVDLQYFVTVVARQDINGDIHKAFSNVTDQRHLDVEPKFELIDAVDVDGDGRAELLFRKEYDEGTAYVVYRVIGDQLYALFEGTPGE